MLGFTTDGFYPGVGANFATDGFWEIDGPLMGIVPPKVIVTLGASSSNRFGTLARSRSNRDAAIDGSDSNRSIDLKSTRTGFTP